MQDQRRIFVAVLCCFLFVITQASLSEYTSLLPNGTDFEFDATKSLFGAVAFSERGNPQNSIYVNTAHDSEWANQQFEKWAGTRLANRVNTQQQQQPGNFSEMLPQFVGSVTVNGDLVQWSSPCFQEVSARVLSIDDSGVEIEYTTSKRKSSLCHDVYLIATAESFHTQFAIISGRHTLKIKGWKDNELDDVKQHGFRVFIIREGLIATIRDIWNTINLFIAEQNNIRFLEQYMNVRFKERTFKDILPLNETDIHDGDHFAILRFKGSETMIVYGTGGRTDHVAVALRLDDGKLYVLESIGSPGIHGRSGIIKTPYRTWIEEVHRHDCNVALLPLAPKYRAKFNSAAARKFFSTVEGLPYGFHNFFFGWIDTPGNNYPPPLSEEFVVVGLSLFAKIAPSLTTRMVLEALNKRLGTVNLDFSEIYQECLRRKISVSTLAAMPERDHWIYSDGRSLVCSSFATSLYKAAGVFDGVEIQGTEFTPKDLVEVNIYDKESIPRICTIVDPTLPYCQLTGRYLLELPGYSSIDPYTAMNERCGGVPIDYIREPPNC